jgi:[acyl-carrier-protein] S-malonyltransferase
MNKIAFLFPGQGAQYAGMGKDFYEHHLIAKQTYEEANERLGFSISHLCFSGPEEELIKTENAQPAILATSVAILSVIKQAGFSCDYTAGLSLGEYSALVHAESMLFSDAIELVRKRGQYMNQAAQNGLGKMGAVIGLTDEALRETIAHAQKTGIIEIANYNTHEQIVLSGEREAIKSALKKARELGAKKVLPLPVSAPFHCSLMEPAEKMFQKSLDRIALCRPKIPVVNNVEARVICSEEDIYHSLMKQVSHSVLWRQTVEFMLDQGVRTFFEIGPGSTLSHFVDVIAAHSNIEVNSESVEDLEGFDRMRRLFEGP